MTMGMGQICYILFATNFDGAEAARGRDKSGFSINTS
jgi:hypothetical protein